MVLVNVQDRFCLNEQSYLYYIRNKTNKQEQRMPRYTIIQEPSQSQQARQPRRSNGQSDGQYVQRLRQVLEMNRRNQYYNNQHGFNPRYYHNNVADHPQPRFEHQRSDDEDRQVGNTRDLRQDDNETVHLPKIRKKNKVARAVRYQQIDSNDRQIIRNYMNAKLVQFKPKKPSKKKNKKRNHTVDEVGQLPQNLKNRKYYTYKSRTPIQGLQNFLVHDANKFNKIRQKASSSRTQHIQYPKNKRVQSYHPNSQSQPNYSDYLDRSKFKERQMYESYQGGPVRKSRANQQTFQYLNSDYSPQNKYKSRKIYQVQASNPKPQRSQNFPYDYLNSYSYPNLSNQKNQSPYKDKNNKEWQQVDPLNLQTFFVKLKKVANLSPDISKLQKPKIKIPKIPTRQQYSKFIKNYIPQFQQIKMQQLIKEDSFQIIQDEAGGKQSFYFGQTKNDKRHGKGIYLTQKIVFQGIWASDQKVRGIEITQSGKYKGQYRDNQRSGKGEFFWSHGQYYSGQWKCGKKNGSGYWKSLKGQSYMGEWKNGLVTGYGVHTMKTGQKYEGQFINFLKHGFGKQDFPNGDHYEGRYVQGQPHGSGKYIWKNNTTYVGEFIEGYREGKGILTVPSRLQFEGSFKSQMIHGLGILKFANGDVYNGMFQNNKRNGHGILDIKSQKRIIKGIWENNQLFKKQQ